MCVLCDTDYNSNSSAATLGVRDVFRQIVPYAVSKWRSSPRTRGRTTVVELSKSVKIDAARSISNFVCTCTL